MPEIRVSEPDPREPAWQRVCTAADRVFETIEALEDLDGAHAYAADWAPKRMRKVVATLDAAREAIEATLDQLAKVQARKAQDRQSVRVHNGIPVRSGK